MESSPAAEKLLEGEVLDFDLLFEQSDPELEIDPAEGCCPRAELQGQ